jgi:hypothetical protein
MMVVFVEACQAVVHDFRRVWAESCRDQDDQVMGNDSGQERIARKKRHVIPERACSECCLASELGEYIHIL